MLRGFWTGQWALVAEAAGAVGLVLAGPLVAVLTARRRVLESGYGMKDMVRALRIDLERRKEKLALEQGKDAPPHGRVTRFVSYAGLGVAGLGALWLFLPGCRRRRCVVGDGGEARSRPTGRGWWRGAGARRQKSTRAEPWLEFWESTYGKWAVGVAGLGLGTVEPSADALVDEPIAPAEAAVSSPRRGALGRGGGREFPGGA